jgi:hypothetical protein
MSEHCGYVVKVNELRKHPNADRLNIATFFGNDTCVSLDIVMGEIGIYFPVDLQLSEEFCLENHLLRKKPDGTPDTGYMDPKKRNVTAVRLRGEKSDGLFLPLKCVVYTGINLDELNIGDIVTTLNGHEICKKYIPIRKHHSADNKVNKTRKKKVPIAPLFVEHADTEQLAYNMGAFKNGDLVEITLKMHGTSGRTGYLPRLVDIVPTNVLAVFCEIKDRDRKLNKLQKAMIAYFDKHSKPKYDWGLVSGTRRTVLDSFDGGFYGSNEFREKHEKVFEGKLHKDETVYYEIVGFTDDGTPIMPKASNKKLNNKEFIKQYGEETVFSYGCDPDNKKSDLYVYRMTITNEDGDVVEYTPDFMRYRCEQMGVKCVPLLWKGFIPEEVNPGEYIKEIAEKYYDGPDPVGKTHVREGVVCRILNRPGFAAYKHKNYDFKCLSGIAVAQAEASGETDNVSEDLLSEM